MTKLLTTLIHIVDNNEIENSSMKIFIDTLNQYKKIKTNQN